jgi:hypothetical protein
VGAKIASFDAFVFVTPEYNHSTLGALKNAIDFLFAARLAPPLSCVDEHLCAGRFADSGHRRRGEQGRLRDLHR